MFSGLLKDLVENRGQHLNNFSLNAPILEELFVDLEKEAEKKKYGVDDNGIEIFDLPKTDNVERPGLFKTTLRLCGYRIKVYFRQTTYLFMSIVVPIALLAYMLPSLRKIFIIPIFS